MADMIEVEASELSGVALDWAVAESQGWSHPNIAQPSIEWSMGGPLVKKYNIQISPPTSPVHVHGGPNNGWKQSGMWSATTYEPGISGKRAHAWHKTEPLIAAMRCLVEFKLGRKVMVPAVLLGETGHD